MKGSYLVSKVTIYDGRNLPPREGALLVRDGVIERVGDVPRWNAPEDTEYLELPGFAVCPGFINMHSHSDSRCL